MDVRSQRAVARERGHTGALALAIALLPIVGLVALVTSSAPSEHGRAAPAATAAPPSLVPLANRLYDSGWRQVGIATFPGTSLDTSTWSVYDGVSSNPEQSRSASFVHVAGGLLNLFTQGAMGSGLCWCKNRPESLYGRWEIKERMSAAADHGEATLLWPANNQWPSEGEIDVSEMNTASRQVATTTVHYSAANLQVGTTYSANFTHWHVFAVEWEPNDIRVWRDGVPVFSTTNPAVIPHTPMYLAMQAGPNVTQPDGSSATLQVASVKVFAP